jgi:hypothetical protein
MHMSGIRLIDKLTCCRHHNTATLQSCVEAEENWRKQALLRAVQERHIDSVANGRRECASGPMDTPFFYPAESHGAVAYTNPNP